MPRLRDNIIRIRKLINEAHIDQNGRLVGFNPKIMYPFKAMSPFINGFISKYGSRMIVQGWFIFDSDTELPNDKYASDGRYWQIQKIDDPELFDKDEVGPIGQIEDDFEADQRAKELGLMVDEYGVIYGYEGKPFTRE